MLLSNTKGVCESDVINTLIHSAVREQIFAFTFAFITVNRILSCVDYYPLKIVTHSVEKNDESMNVVLWHFE